MAQEHVEAGQQPGPDGGESRAETAGRAGAGPRAQVGADVLRGEFFCERIFFSFLFFFFFFFVLCVVFFFFFLFFFFFF
ncbi:hypothetical protein, partial [Streptomyces lividans]|uniref:hypothetical protein n=1 Tax=Streptomyces lividans TaxID=1916 RepID=UPI001AD7E704